LRAKAIRDQREAELRRSGHVSSIPKSASGFVDTDDIRITGTAAAGSKKRPFSSVATPDPIPASNRDGTNQSAADGALRPARKFAKFVDYNMSAMTDTKGGFLTAEDDPHNAALAGPQGKDDSGKPKSMTAKEWERLQTIRSLQRQKAGPFEPGLSVLKDEKEKKTCRECGRFEIDWVWDEVFKVSVCSVCKEKYPERYSLLTKTECKEDYLLTDRELSSGPA
jgi:DNA-repair protein complementing XP-A cells